MGISGREPGAAPLDSPVLAEGATFVPKADPQLPWRPRIGAEPGSWICLQSSRAREPSSKSILEMNRMD